jgi:hypothetical protein
MPLLSPGQDIAQIVQLSIAPVFLIAGIGTLLNVLTQRLARVVDRGRKLEAELAETPDPDRRARHLVELAMIDKRLSRINASILLSTVAVLFTCLVVVALFAGGLLELDVSAPVAGLFIATMAALVMALLAFLGEIGIALRMLRVRADLLGSRAPRG